MILPESSLASKRVRGEIITMKKLKRRSLMKAGSLLWIAEAVGIDELTVKQAYEAAVAAGDYRRACGAIRKIITWDMIYALAQY